MTNREQVAAVLDPPERLWGALRFLGPGFVLSAAIVGSGELIATTALGAKAGFVLLWVILFSCLVKVAVQLEYGRHAISHGRPSFQAWNAGAGPRLLNVHWSLYAGLLFLFSAFLGAAGIMGGAAQVLVYVFPPIRLEVCVGIIVLMLGLLVFHGRYRLVEIIAGVFNFVFVSTILYCNIATQSTRYAYSFGDLASGVTFRLPSEGLALAVAVFGITGVGAGEIVMYPYWCLEKGYAAWTGPRDDSPEWARRARGWIRVMHFDALLAMAVYTTATCGFYLLGAAVLRPQGTLADGNELVLQLSGVFTNVLGQRSKTIFMVCALTVLFSTLFSNTAGLSRLWTDMLGVFKLIDASQRRHRLRAVAVMAWALPLIWGVVYLTFQRPLYLVVFMGISNALFLVVVAYQAVIFRYRHTDRRLIPSPVYDVALWLSILSTGFVAGKIMQSLFS